MSDASMSVKHKIQAPRMFLHKSRTTIHPWRMIKDIVAIGTSEDLTCQRQYLRVTR